MIVERRDALQLRVSVEVLVRALLVCYSKVLGNVWQCRSEILELFASNEDVIYCTPYNPK